MRILYNPTLMALTIVTLAASCTIAPSLILPTMPTGIPYVDVVIDAVQFGGPQALKTLLVLHKVPCTTEKWLLRQPLCPEGEKDGTLSMNQNSS